MGHASQVRFDVTKQAYYCRHKRRKHYLGKDLVEAHRRFTKIVGHHSPAGTPDTIAEAVEAFLLEHPVALNRECANRWAKYFRTKELSEADDAHLAAYLKWQQRRGLALNTISHDMKFILRVLRWSNERGWLEKVPRKPPMAKPPVGFRDYTPQQVRDLTAALAVNKARSTPLILFVMATGCRPSEAANLEWDSVNLDRGICELERHKTQRTGRVRTIFLTDDAAIIIKRQKRGARYVFPNAWGQPFSRRGLWKAMVRRGLPGIQPLRHTFAQHALESGVPMEVVAKLLGHADLSTVKVYAQVRNPQALAAARSLVSPARQALSVPSPRAKADAEPERPAKRKASPRKPATRRRASRSGT